MTNEQIRIAVAEACGLKLTSVPPTWYDQHSRLIPNYPTNLNACAEMEKMLDREQSQIYSNHLGEILLRDFINKEQGGKLQHKWHATALQRCEAFLRTIGKWVD